MGQGGHAIGQLAVSCPLSRTFEIPNALAPNLVQNLEHSGAALF